MKLNLNKIVFTLKTMREYLFPIKKLTSKFSTINSKEDLQNFVQERSAHVTQTTLYGYLKTRIGTRYQLMLMTKNILNQLILQNGISTWLLWQI